VTGPGTQLGPYEITAPLGAGGMGEVYRARDTRLERDVAIKVLPQAFSADADRLRRFEQEARAAAALNHPNILAVYDVGTHDGAPYIVSELLEGETLRDRLGPPPAPRDQSGAQPGLPARKVVDYAIQIAHGLAAAHEKGIVHRDLKPENLFVTSAGHVKILDFGLAKLRPESKSASVDRTALPTELVDTEPGMLLGTMGYMAPEQVRGQTVDHRCDIFAFGAILYEMLSGQRAFRGATAADTISAILDKDPADLPVADLHIAPALERIVDRCLSKHPGARFQSASDLAFALESLSSPSDRFETVRATAASSVSRASRERVAWSVAALFALATIGALTLARAGYFANPIIPPRPSRTLVLLPEKTSYVAGGGSPAYRLGISPDGSRLSFVAVSADGQARLWVRPIDALTAHPLAGTESASGPAWSSDGRSIAYFTTPLTALKKVDAAGGPPVTLVNVEGQGGAGATWNKNDVILFATTNSNYSGPIWRVSSAGGNISAVIAPDSKNGETELWYPFFLPDGNHFLFAAMGPLEGLLRPLGIYVASLDGKERKLLMRGGSNVKYAQGYLLFLRDATLMAQKFDADRLELSGEAIAIGEQVQTGGPSGATGAFAVSEAGTLAFISGPSVTAGVPSQLIWFNRDGRQLSVLGDRATYSDVELSPDGARATVSVIDPSRRTSDIWIYDVGRGLRTKFTFDAGSELSSVWSPDGKRIVYGALRTRPVINLKRSDASGGEEQIAAPGGIFLFPSSFSPDGHLLAYSAGASAVFQDIWIMPLTGDRTATPILKTPASELYPRFSPDGRWLMYTSDESGRPEVYVSPFPPSGGKVLISTSGGTQPRWRHDATEIFYISSDNKLMAASVNGRGAGFQVGSVKALFDVNQRVGSRSQYDASADGQRFLINIAPEQAQATPPITLVMNWTAELKSAR